MKSSSPGVFSTNRLRVRAAVEDDAMRIHALWTDPRVTTFVGFPHGIPTSVEKIEEQIERDRDRPFKRLLIVERRSDGLAIGQVKLGEPDDAGISEPDIKLDPAHWGQGYGRELWRGMIAHLFAVSTCGIVQGTPNIANSASISMMKSCGMSRVGEGCFVPLPAMGESMVPVRHDVYHITRETWQATNG